MLDLIVRGGTVVAPHGVGAWDVAVKDGTIVAVAAAGSLTDDVGRIVDATGKLVIPGGIDPHIHAKWPIPDPRGPTLQSADPTQVSRAALFGGTTTLIDFAPWRNGSTLRQALEERDADFVGQTYTDFAYHLIVMGDVDPNIVAEIPDAIQEGFASIKIFTTDITPSRKGRMVGMGSCWEVFQQVARAGGICAIHAEDNDLVMHQYAKLEREGRTHFTNMSEVHSKLSEDLSFRRIIRLAQHVEGTALYMVHVSAREGVEAIAEARANGLPIYGETLHHYTTFTSDAYKRSNGQIYHTYPSLKGAEDCEAMWRGMRDGSIGSIATDAVCTPLQVKVMNDRIDNTTGGHAGVEPRMGVMYTEAVVRRGFSLQHYVDITSANAARVFGMYPKKGALAVGSDADITLIDPSIRRTLRAEDLHEADYSPWEGWEVAGWPTTTILRGKVMVEGGELYGLPSDGRHLKRKVADAIRGGPAT